MAAWQADFELRSDDTRFLPDYRARLSALLSAGRPWAPELEMWGEEDGNRIDVWTAPRTEGAEALLRIDMRNYDSACAARLDSQIDRAAQREAFMRTPKPIAT